MCQTRRDPRKLTNITEILSCLSEFQAEEAELSNSLGDLIATREPIQASLSRLAGLLPELNDLHSDASLLSEKVSQTAETAHRVGSRVRSLDEEMRRVREAAERVSQVMELKSSLSDLQLAVAAKDWETAALHCGRAMALPQDVILGPFAEKAVPTEDSHLPPSQTLQTAREDLLRVFRENFEKASAARDSAATSRFFKLFPAIGWEEEGLRAYGAFVTELVRVPSGTNRSSPLYYVSSLTALFESIAMIVDQHRPVVEKYYGVGRMKSVVSRLLEKCDTVVARLVEDWEEDRFIQRKLAEVASNPPPSSFGPTARTRQPSGTDEESLDPREIDTIASEVAVLGSRWNIFRKFLSESFRTTKTEADEDPYLAQFHAMESTSSHATVERILGNYYLPLETWYLRTIIDKVGKILLLHIRLSSSDFSISPPTTTTPDDVFYVLKLVITRLLTTGSKIIVPRALEQVRDILDREYAGVIRRKLEDVYRPGGSASSGVRGEKTERESRVSFIILLNDLDISSSHLERLLRDFSASSILPQHFVPAEETLVRQALTSLTSLSTKFKGILRVGIEQLFNQLLRPKLRNLVADVYKDVSYILDEDTYSTSEYQDVVRKRFIKSWESLGEIYRDTFTEANHRQFFGLALDVLLRPWEKHLLTFKYTELGAIRFDRDLRAITSYLTGQTAFGDTREKFVRLQQIATLLNLDAEEDVDDFYNTSGITWKLTLAEARVVANLKV
ncbi:COG4 transport protein-domain-containing protein [Flagelloscypha sp. PMI_526]|nr:COG4 transport protein-domain-containing protein [Flagelloscypha sp. PMI_526]